MEIILLCFCWQVRLWLTESSGNLLKDICLHGKGTGYIIPFLKDACNLNGYLRNWGVLGDPYYSSSLKLKYSEKKKAFLFVGITFTFPCSCTLHAPGSSRLKPRWTSVTTKTLAASVWSIIPGINIYKDTPFHSFFPMVLMVKFQSERESTRQTKNTAVSTFWSASWLPKLNTLSSFVN